MTIELCVTESFEEMRRRQRVGREALRLLDARHFAPDEVDDEFYRDLREALLAAGATESDIDGFAVDMVTWSSTTRQAIRQPVASSWS